MTKDKRIPNQFWNKPYRFFKILFIPLLLIILLSSCEESKKQGKGLLESRGATAEIIIVMDSLRWRGGLGDAVREVFMQPVPGLPQDEPHFSLIQIKPADFSRFLQRHTNVVFVTSLDDNSASGKRMKNYFTKTSLEMVKKDESKFMFFKNDEFATGQKVMYLFGQTNEKIIHNLIKNGDKILDYFLNAERKRIQTKIYGAGVLEQKRLSKHIFDKTKLDIKIPSGFEVAKIAPNFLWLRMIGRAVDKSIWISYDNYSSTELFDVENIIKWREKFGYKYINDTTLSESYMSTQDNVLPVESRRLKIDKHFVVEYRGLWKLKNKTRGGPFIGYAFVDEKLKRFYYIEGFVYAPNEKKRRPILELESILRTFSLK